MAKELMDKLMSDMELDNVVGGAGYAYFMKREDGKYDIGIQDLRLVSPKFEKDWDVAVGEKCVEVAIPRKLLGKTEKRFSLSFKWADNPSYPGDVISISTTGDTAPNRRFAYRFVWELMR